MKTVFRTLSCLVAVWMGISSVRATDDVWINNGVITTNIPQVDAITFINNGLINIFTTEPYETASTLNYTNSGTMLGANGFQFRWNPTSAGVWKPSENFNNRLGGLIAASPQIFFITLEGITAPHFLRIHSTNIVNRGLMGIEAGGEMLVRGKHVDLSRGGTGVNPIFGIGSFNDTPVLGEFQPDVAVYDLWWAQTNMAFFSSTILTEQGPFLVATAPPHNVQGPGGAIGFLNFQLVNPLTFGYTNLVGGRFLNLTNMDGSPNIIFAPTNITRQAVCVVPDPAYTAAVRFAPSSNPTNFLRSATLELTTTLTNAAFGTIDNATLYLLDSLASEGANGLQTNTVTLISDPGLVTYRPENYVLSRLPLIEFVTGSQPNATVTSGMLYNPNFTNDVVTAAYSAYAAEIDSVVSRPPAVPGGTVTNLSGRVTIVAEESLNLERARIQANGLLTIQTPNLLSSADAIVDAENLSYGFGSTSGNLHVQNVTREQVARMDGQVIAWSAVWTNSEVVVYTNNWVIGTNNMATNSPVTNTVEYTLHAFLVDASTLVNLVPVVVHDFMLSGTNIMMDDAARVVSEMLIDGESFTLNGSLSLEQGLLDWTAPIAPTLKHFTNNGILSVASEAHFGDDRAVPYETFVNNGFITAFGMTVDADECLFTGTNQTFAGLTVESRSAKVEGGLFNVGGDLTLSGDVFRLRDAELLVLGRLNMVLPPTGALADTGGDAGNDITCQGGFALPVKPASGDLLGTTIHSLSPTFALVNHAWAGQDHGPTTNGYHNNAAIGVLSLEPESIFSDFEFQAVGSTNRALYVDLLDLSRLTDYESRIFFTSTNLTIYFAVSEGVPEEELDGAMGGRFQWVSTFAGPNSSVEVLLPDGTTGVFNRARRESLEFDDDHDGLANGYDPTPFPSNGLTISQMAVNSSVQPAHVQFSWMAQPNTVYTVECSDTGASGSWQFLMNVTNSAASVTEITVQDPDPLAEARFYRVFYNP